METIEPIPNTIGLESYNVEQRNKQQFFQTSNDEPLSVQANKYQAFNSPEFRNSTQSGPKAP